MREAISHLNHDPVAYENTPSSADRELILHGTHLRDILLRTFEPAPAGQEHKHVPLEASDEEGYAGHAGLDHGRTEVTQVDMGAFGEDMRIQSWAERYSRPNPIVIDGDPVLGKLNETQTRAMAMMIGKRISLVQGVSFNLSDMKANLIGLRCEASWDWKDEDNHRDYQIAQGMSYQELPS